MSDEPWATIQGITLTDPDKVAPSAYDKYVADRLQNYCQGVGRYAIGCRRHRPHDAPIPWYCHDHKRMAK